ncbi:MAG: hypothetical protein ETSY1_20450 [Candidatus Entotheonella factor]|uniref:DUF1800 domain-containing protein n=1 Tax=Entotheonella factor TaxID=1429438 RepID=W4LKY2_ENTF1|nr:MAG: hypothetical protein ETSY1_20450 [Candidatus Entotheonella factor]
MYRMVNTLRPLEEKLALFWHGVFATGYTKLNQPKAILRQVDMFRRCGMGPFRTLLVEIAKDPAMIFWLDNKDNHKEAVNENFGRELLELFSMGVGNYTEQDVRQCSHAFTGWTMRNAPLHAARVSRDSVWPYGRLDWQFEYQAEDHDDGEKTFLGQTGRFDGEDIIDIICQQPATARFVARHLYTFFVADEVQVPSWSEVPPRDSQAIDQLAETFVQHNGEMRAVLRTLFNANFFKQAQFARVKSPTELVVGAVRMAGGHRFPDVSDVNLGLQAGFMGQQLLDPPSVEGWHTGNGWINTASLMTRINFASEQFADASLPGVQSIIEYVAAQDATASANRLVDVCLELMGPLSVSDVTRNELVEHAEEGLARTGAEVDTAAMTQELLQLIVSTREYQLA